MLQPKNLKKQKGKFWRNFTWSDYAVGIVLTLISFLIGFTVLPNDVHQGWKFLVAIVLTMMASTLLIKSEKYNCRVYILFFRAIKFLFSVKKYGVKNDTKALIPYENIFENKYVKTKRLKSGVKYFSIIKFQGNSPWNEDDSDRESFLNKFIEILDMTSFHISLVRTKELEDYSRNFESLKVNLQRKIYRLKISNADEDVVENYQTYYENAFNDLSLLDTKLLVDKYYIVIYEKTINELKKSIGNVIATFNSMDIESSVIEGIDLISLLAKLNNKELDIELTNKYLQQQMNNQRKSIINNGDEFNDNLTFREKVKELFKFLFSKIKKLFKKKSKKVDVNKLEQNKEIEKVITLDEVLKNKEIIFHHNYYIQDGKFCSIQTISDLPLNLPEGWAIEPFNNDSTIVWNLGVFNESSQAALLDKTSKKTMDNNALVKSKYFQKAGSLQLEAIEYLENQLQIDKNVLMNSSLMIMNKADSLEELRKIEAKNFSLCKKSKIILNPVPFKQFEAFSNSCLIPTDNLKESIAISSYNVAHGWPFENEINNDGNFFLLAETASTGEPIIFDQFYKKSSRRVNYNMFTVGSSGKGKSTDVKKAIVGHLAANNKVYVIDPQNEYSSIGRKFGATIIDLGIGYKTIINPLQVQTQLFSEDEEVNIKLIINKHLEWLENFFKLINEDWNQDYLVLLMSFVRELYEKWKIYDVKTIEQLQKAKYPIISDLIKIIDEYKFIDEYDKSRKQTILAYIKDRLIFNFEHNGKYEYIYNGQTNINLSNDFIIFNTQKLFDKGTNSGKVGTYVLLTFIQNKIFNNYIENQDVNTLLVIDELHMYIDPTNLTTLDFVYTMTKTVRKFNAGMILCTQNPSDFLNSQKVTSKGQAILENCQYAKFFGLRQKDLEAVIDMFKSSGGLNNSHHRFLADANIGNLIFSLHMYSKIKVEIYYNNFEEKLFFTKGRIGEN